MSQQEKAGVQARARQLRALVRRTTMQQAPVTQIRALHRRDQAVPASLLSIPVYQRLNRRTHPVCAQVASAGL
jgi:hypothetical protein